MDERTYYVVRLDGCRFESMTKEQILTAITQAVENHEISDVDTGFVTTLKTISGNPLKFFAGTQAEYDALTDDQKRNLFAIITNDDELQGIEADIEKIKQDIESFSGFRNDREWITAKEGETSFVLEPNGVYVERTTGLTFVYKWGIYTSPMLSGFVNTEDGTKHALWQFEISGDILDPGTPPICNVECYYYDFMTGEVLQNTYKETFYFKRIG